MAAGQAFTLFYASGCVSAGKITPVWRRISLDSLAVIRLTAEARVIHILCLHQARKGLRFIQHGINVLGLRQVLGLYRRAAQTPASDIRRFFDH